MLASDDHQTLRQICLWKVQTKKANLRQGRIKGRVIEHTDDKLFDTEITHYICRSRLCLRL